MSPLYGVEWGAIWRLTSSAMGTKWAQSSLPAKATVSLAQGRLVRVGVELLAAELALREVEREQRGERGCGGHGGDQADRADQGGNDPLAEHDHRFDRRAREVAAPTLRAGLPADVCGDPSDGDLAAEERQRLHLAGGLGGSRRRVCARRGARGDR